MHLVCFVFLLRTSRHLLHLFMKMPQHCFADEAPEIRINSLPNFTWLSTSISLSCAPHVGFMSALESRCVLSRLFWFRSTAWVSVNKQRLQRGEPSAMMQSVCVKGSVVSADVKQHLCNQQVPEACWLYIDRTLIFKDPDCTIARGLRASSPLLKIYFIPAERWFRCI